MIELIEPFATSKMACKAAQLTTRGILQHQEIGKYLGDVYAKYVKAGLEINTKVSTHYSRTVLSLISFLSAFDSKWCKECGTQHI